ncbi:MAG TPA: ATP-binding protein [Planctomycetota bacterium]|nr:ATP-binding protein [Planctomycetota bacterium]
MGLRRRIVLPFVALFTLAFGATAAAILAVASQSVEENLLDRVQSLDDLIQKVDRITEFPTYAVYLKTVYRADLAVLRQGEPTPFCTLPDGLARQLRDFRPPERTFVPWNGFLALRHGDCFLFFPPGVLADQKRAVIVPVLWVAGAGLGVVILAGIVLGHSIARPIEELASRARSLTGRGDETLGPAKGGGPELAQLVDALNRMLDTLRRSERLAVMGRLAAGVAHEIKNPLSAMKMTVQMLREEKPAGEREPFDLILREIERLDLVASELSAAARPGPPVREPVRLDRAVGDVLDLLARQLGHLRVELERRIDAPAEVTGDGDRLKRAAMNLVLNGAQAMPQGGRLTVALERAGGRVRFTVSDTGTGVPPDLRDRIFEPFVTGRPDGVGLGLTLTKRIVEDHGGRIGFESSDRGSTFWIELPEVQVG